MSQSFGYIPKSGIKSQSSYWGVQDPTESSLTFSHKTIWIWYFLLLVDLYAFNLLWLQSIQMFMYLFGKIFLRN
jgi:hypothetical protein